jgi:hypothetical protein
MEGKKYVDLLLNVRKEYKKRLDLGEEWYKEIKSMVKGKLIMTN